MAITKLVLNGTSYDLGNISYNIDTLNELTGPQTYTGVELSNTYSWSDIQTIAKNGTADANGIRVGDYYTITLNNSSSTPVVCQIAGIDTYYRAGSTQQGHHIDFISKDCLPDTVVWNQSTTATTTMDDDDGTVTGAGNNGTADVTNPFMASYVYYYLNNTIYPTLPSDLQAVIKQKQLYAETRYSSSGLISDSTGNAWITMPQLWLPTEYEVFGSTILGTKGYSARDAVQYPLFANSWYHRIKGSGSNGGRCTWWLATSYSGNSTSALHVTADGIVSNFTVTNTSNRVPLCFRVGA